MKKVLEIFTFQGGYMGGVATMVDAYMKGVKEFSCNNCKLTHLNISPTINTGNGKIDNFAYIFTQRKAIRKYWIRIVLMWFIFIHQGNFFF